MMPRVLPSFRMVVLTGLMMTVYQSQVRSDDRSNGVETGNVQEDGAQWNLPMKTLGGRQFWGDVRFFHDWRIQQNVYTGHYRLLDGNDVRHAWGTLEACEERLEEIRTERNLPRMEGKAVIVVHGIVRSSKSFSALSAELRDAGYVVFGFDYPSTRVEIPVAADYLKQCVRSLDGVTEVNFVVHSMGGLVVRSMLADERDPRFHRMVMLGVPNLGARMANLLQTNALYRAVYGPAGQQLIEHPEGFIANLPTPDFEFALISGARGTEDGYNPLIPGDDDGTVSLDATRLPGAHDFMTVRALHSLIMHDRSAIDASRRFIESGALRESGERQPVPLADAQENPDSPSDTRGPITAVP